MASESAPGKSFAARVESVGQVDPQSGLAHVRVSVFGAGALKIGALASCDIIVARRAGAIVAPRQAVITREGKPTIFVAKPDGTAEERAVTIGEESGGLVEIRKGLKAGEKVIRLGQYELEDGARVRPAASGAASAGEEDSP